MKPLLLLYLLAATFGCTQAPKNGPSKDDGLLRGKILSDGSLIVVNPSCKP